MSDKKVKMVLYGEPGVGKSTFAAKAPNPLFICSDGNFAWLDLPDENGIEVSSWHDCKQVLNNDEFLSKYETIVLDLTEDFFKWCEQEYCVRNKIDHISDHGFGKGYDATRNEFFIELCKLFASDKNVILIMHGNTWSEKDRRGVEHTKHGPSSRMPDKLTDMIEGRVRYFLRCYIKDIALEDGTLIKKRYLSIVPKPGEFGISRGLDEATVPHDIDLDWDAFAEVIGLNAPQKKKAKAKAEEKVEAKVEEKVEVKTDVEPEVVKDVDNVESVTLDGSVKVEVAQGEGLPFNKTPEDIKAKVAQLKASEEAVPVKEEPKAEEKKETSQEDKIAAIRAKLAALNNK